MWGLMARGWDVQVYDYEADNEGEQVSGLEEFAKFLNSLVNNTDEEDED